LSGHVITWQVPRWSKKDPEQLKQAVELQVAQLVGQSMHDQGVRSCGVLSR
jgi:hypothetical protein